MRLSGLALLKRKHKSHEVVVVRRWSCTTFGEWLWVNAVDIALSVRSDPENNRSRYLLWLTSRASQYFITMHLRSRSDDDHVHREKGAIRGYGGFTTPGRRFQPKSPFYTRFPFRLVDPRADAADWSCIQLHSRFATLPFEMSSFYPVYFVPSWDHWRIVIIHRDGKIKWALICSVNGYISYRSLNHTNRHHTGNSGGCYSICVKHPILLSFQRFHIYR